MPIAPVQVLLILPALREEFLQPLAELRRLAQVIECQTPSGAVEFLHQVESPPVLVVIAQSRPGEFVPDDLDQLVQLAPLARFVLLLGSWCEGETRTGRIWPGATRVFWYEWPGEVARNLPVISAGRFAPWIAPATTLEEERYLFGSLTSLQAEKNVEMGLRPLVLVSTRRNSYGEALCTACHQAGYRALWHRPDRPERIDGVGAIIWEGVQLLPAEVKELRAIANCWPQIPIIALADFPGLKHKRELLPLGLPHSSPSPARWQTYWRNLSVGVHDRLYRAKLRPQTLPSSVFLPLLRQTNDRKLHFQPSSAGAT